MARVWEAGTGVPVSPPLKHDSWVRNARFSADGKQVITFSSSRKLRSGTCPETTAQLGDLLLLAQLLSDSRLDATSGLVPCETAVLRQAWQGLREAATPNSFTCSPDQVLSWHRQEAHEAEAAAIWPEAWLHLQARVDADPRSALLHSRLARALMETGQSEKVLSEYNRAIELHAAAADPSIHFNRGRVLARLGQWEKVPGLHPVPRGGP